MCQGCCWIPNRLDLSLLLAQCERHSQPAAALTRPHLTPGRLTRPCSPEHRTLCCHFHSLRLKLDLIIHSLHSIGCTFFFFSFIFSFLGLSYFFSSSFHQIVADRGILIFRVREAFLVITMTEHYGWRLWQHQRPVWKAVYSFVVFNGGDHFSSDLVSVWTQHINSAFCLSLQVGKNQIKLIIISHDLTRADA